jgi:uncharacterized membrane protein YraQ (UPF0718 family)
MSLMSFFMDADAKQQLRRLMIGGIAMTAAAILIALLLASGGDLSPTISIFTTRFLGIFIEAAPFLLMGSLVSGLIDAFVRADDIARLIPRSPAAATAVGTLLGFIFPVCECGVVPVVRRLYMKGLPMSVGVAFLLAAPVVNPVVLASTYVAFGAGPVLIGRFALTILIAAAVGMIFAAAARPQDVLRPTSLAPIMGGSDAPARRDGAFIPLTSSGVMLSARPTLLAGLRIALRSANRDFFDMGRYLIIGTFLAATMQTLVSENALMSLGSGPILSVIVMQLLAFVLSVCSTVDSFLALAFASTFTTGSILAFLTFGPMIDIKSMLMFAGIFKRRVVLYLVVLPFLMALLAGIWINFNLAL